MYLLRVNDEVLKSLTQKTPEEKIRRETANEPVIPEKSLENGLITIGFKDNFSQKYFKIHKLNHGRQYFDFSL